MKTNNALDRISVAQFIEDAFDAKESIEDTSIMFGVRDKKPVVLVFVGDLNDGEPVKAIDFAECIDSLAEGDSDEESLNEIRLWRDAFFAAAKKMEECLE